MSERLILVEVEPQPSYIESSGRWSWPLSPPHDNEGRCPAVYDASRSWWEYVPDGAKPCPGARAARLDLHDGSEAWYWVVPAPPSAAPGIFEAEQGGLREALYDAEKKRGLWAHYLRSIAQRLDVGHGIGLEEAAVDCLKTIDSLEAELAARDVTIKDLKAEVTRRLRLVEQAYAAHCVPWHKEGTPGSEPPEDDPDALAIVKGEDGPTWELVRCGGKHFEDPFGYDVEVLEYWPLPPADEGWERVWRRKP